MKRPVVKNPTIYINWSKFTLAMLLSLLLSLGLNTRSTAQSDTLTLTITDIDSRAFPQVTVFVTVTDQNGLPVSGLSPADFALVEDDLPVAADNLSVQSVPIKGRHLVLAIDLSTYDDILPQVKTAANAFIDQLQPEDRVSVVAFYDKIETLTDFTNNKAVLHAAIDSLVPTGEYTTLNNMVSGAAQMVDDFPAGRKGVIILPDCKNNIGADSPESAIDEIQTAQTPLYLIGVQTKKIELPDLDAFAAQTAGLTTVAAPEAVGGILQEIARQPQGYRLTFRSQLQADNETHSLLIEAASGQAAGSFVATANPVTVILPNIYDGQTVGGVVNLTAEVRTPAPPTTVSYLLNGQLLGQSTVAPYNLAWDSTMVTPGPHRLVVQAADSANNRGQAEVQLNVILPIKVTISAPQTEVALGENVTIQVQIEALAELARVDLFVDGAPLATNTTAPYDFTFDNGAYEAGVYTISVRAEDVQGYAAEDSLTMEFLPYWPERIRSWLGIEDRGLFAEWVEFAKKLVIILGGLLIILLLMLLAWLLLSRLSRALEHYGRQTYGFAVLNAGNVKTRYEVWAEETADALHFGFFLRGADLREQTREVVETIPLDEPEPSTTPEPAAQAVEVSAPSSGDETSSRPEPGGSRSKQSRQSAKKGLKSAKDQTQKAMGISGAISGLLITVSRILPRSMARPLQSTANRMRAGQTRMQQTMRAPTRMAATTSRVKRQATALAPTGASSETHTQTASERSTRPARTTAASRQDIEPGPAPAATQMYSPPATAVPASSAGNGRQAKTIIVTLERAQTPPIAPGETLTLDLRIDPVDPRQTRAYTFDVYSRPLEQPDEPPLVETGTIKIRRPSWLRRWGPVFLVLFITAWLILFTLLLMFWLLNINLWGIFTDPACVITGATC